MATASYVQSATAFRTDAAMRAAVRVGPEGTFRGAFWPLTRSLTLLPPTSTTRIFTAWPPGTAATVARAGRGFKEILAGAVVRTSLGGRGDAGGHATPVPPRPQ